jgi:hypothetical protein
LIFLETIRIGNARRNIRKNIKGDMKRYEVGGLRKPASSTILENEPRKTYGTVARINFSSISNLFSRKR